MRQWTVAVALAVLAVLCLAGCGNVYLRGEALTAAETSAMDALQAAQRAGAEPATPAWEKAYLEENFKQWRFLVRSPPLAGTAPPRYHGKRHEIGRGRASGSIALDDEQATRSVCTGNGRVHTLPLVRGVARERRREAARAASPVAKIYEEMRPRRS